MYDIVESVLILQSSQSVEEPDSYTSCRRETVAKGLRERVKKLKQSSTVQIVELIQQLT